MRTPGYTKKPMGYWQDPANIDCAVLEYVARHGQTGVMPTETELKSNGHSAIAHAIRKRSAFPEVATRLGLQFQEHAKPKGYWDDFANIEREVRRFMADGHGGFDDTANAEADGNAHPASTMPTHEQFEAAGRADLAGAFSRHGGIRAVASRLGLEPAKPKVPNGYWKNRDNLVRALEEFIAEHGTPGVMPSHTRLREAGATSLSSALHVYGSYKLAEEMGLSISSDARPPGYWNDFQNLKRELLGFIDAHGTPGTMPPQKLCARLGYQHLPNAIQKHGGYRAVAARLNLELSDKRTPKGYYDDFARVEEDIHAFVQEHNLGELMPTSTQLKQAGKNGLWLGIEKHGGVSRVAERLGLRSVRKKPGHWRSVESVEEELRGYLMRHGTPVELYGVPRIPTYTELEKAGYGPLAAAISKLGYDVLAARLDLVYVPRATEQEPLDDFANLEEAVRNYVLRSGTPGVMPSMTQLTEDGLQDLRVAIQKHGGVNAVAQRLGLLSSEQHRRISTTYGGSLEGVCREVRQFAALQGIVNRMPTMDELRSGGRGELISAIQKFGGVSVVTERLGLRTRKSPTPSTKPPGYWRDLENVRREIEQFNAARNSTLMPKSNELEASGLWELQRGIIAHGGYAKVAVLLGLAPTFHRSPGRYWSDWERFSTRVLQCARENGAPDVMPSRVQLCEYGVGAAVDRHGGIYEVARRLGMRLEHRRPRSYWNDFEQVRRELSEFIEKRGTAGVMPSLAELKRNGPTGLGDAISEMWGGPAAVAERLGLRLSVTARPDGYWGDFEHVREEIEAFIRQRGRAGLMPTGPELQSAGLGSLVWAIGNHGGMQAVAERLGLEIDESRRKRARHQPRVPADTWADFGKVEAAVLRVVAEVGTPGVMPTRGRYARLAIRNCWRAYVNTGVLMPSLNALSYGGRGSRTDTGAISPL